GLVLEDPFGNGHPVPRGELFHLHPFHPLVLVPGLNGLDFLVTDLRGFSQPKEVIDYPWGGKDLVAVLGVHLDKDVGSKKGKGYLLPAVTPKMLLGDGGTIGMDAHILELARNFQFGPWFCINDVPWHSLRF